METLGAGNGEPPPVRLTTTQSNLRPHPCGYCRAYREKCNHERGAKIEYMTGNDISETEVIFASVADLLSIKADNLLSAKSKLLDIIEWAGEKGKPTDVVRSALLRLGNYDLNPLERVWKHSQLDLQSQKLKREMTHVKQEQAELNTKTDGSGE